MKRIAMQKKIILTGSLIIKETALSPLERAGSEVYYNRMIWMLPNGEYGFYDKRHLFAYAGEDQHYTPGHRRLVTSVKGWRINLLVCYDLRFPVWSRLTPPADDDKTFEYDLTIFVANWPDKRINAWRTLLQARAIENQCFVIGVNRVGMDAHGNNHSGDSMIIGPLGEVIYHKENEEDIFTTTLDKTVVEKIREHLPFWKDADDFKIIED